MKVLLIPEDQTVDQYIIKPVVESLLADLGKANARVDVLGEPRLRGAGQALDPTVVGQIVAENRMVDLFLLLVDRDCDREGNEARAAEREGEYAGRLIACCAWQEIEVWMLTAFKERLRAEFSVSWREVREECDPKERFAEPLLEGLGSSGPGRGRKAAMRYVKLTDLMTCDELVALRERLRQFLAR